MRSNTSVASADAIAFRRQKERDQQRLRAGIENFRRALEQDAEEAVARGSGLPEDWRNRVLK